MSNEYLELFPQDDSSNVVIPKMSFECKNIKEGACVLGKSACTFGNVEYSLGMGICSEAQTDGGL